MSDTLTVSLGPRSYPIQFGSNLFAEIRAQVDALRAEGHGIIVVCDEILTVADAAKIHAINDMFGLVPIHSVPIGESSENRKSLATLEQVLETFANGHVGRRDVVFAVGGGVIGDLVGFAAACYLRGIAFYQVPTTLLAMVDSSVGGKTGINLKAGKNLVGAFHQPRGVFISTNLLSTLPPREFAAGCAEIIKAGLLGDAELFTQLERAPLTLSSPDLINVIRRCCALKARVVEADEFENAPEGGRALLNLGHTFGHAIEQVTGYGGYLHGEAVAIGLCAAARLSSALGLIEAGEVARVEAVVTAHKLPIRLRDPLPLAALMAAMARDKKVRAGQLRFVVLASLGVAVTREGVDPEMAAAAFREVGAG